jgi:hypothetical protein
MRRQLSILSIGLAFLLLNVSGASAHDAERTEVTLTFDVDGSFVLDIANDPNWLLLRLEDFTRDYPTLPPTPAGPLSDADRDARLETLAPTVIDRIVMWVDDGEVRPTKAEYIPGPRPVSADVVSRGVYRLRGQMPIGARTMQWFYGIVIDPYPMTIRRADHRVESEAVLGNAWSRRLDLSGQFHAFSAGEISRRFARVGYTALLPNGVPQILLLVSLILLPVTFARALIQIGTFAASSSLAAAAAAAGSLAVNPQLAALLTAAAIAGVTIDNMLSRNVGRRRLAIAILCGLVQGVSAAHAIADAPIPGAHFSTGVLAFDVGLVGAQLTVAAITSVVAIRYVAGADGAARELFQQRFSIPASLALGAAGLYLSIASAAG